MAELAPQPDHRRIHQSFCVLTEEFEKFPNIPAFDSGNRILNAIAQMNNDIHASIQRLDNKLDAFIVHTNQRFDQLEGKVDQLEGKVDAIQTRMVASENNTVARVQNSQLARSSEPLFALNNAATNAPIEGFPATSREIRTMQVTSLNSVLRDLGLPLSGRKEDKEKRLRQHIGLQPQPDQA